MKKKITLLLKLLILIILIAFTTFGSWGQTTVFSDDFTRASVSPGGNPSMTYTSTIGTGSGQTATIPANDFLNLQNSSNAGNIYVTGVASTFLNFFNSTLSSNTGTVEWTFNSRYVRSTAASGIASGNYGYAVVLAATSSSIHNTGDGYAIVYGNSGSPDPVRLVKYTNGLQGTLTDVITTLPLTANIADIRGFASVRVKYIPSTNSWSLYVRDDGTIAWVNVMTTPVPDVNQYGVTVVDNTYTSSSMTNFGFFWCHAATTAQKSTFDNFKVSVNVPVTWTSGWPKAENPTPNGFTAKTNVNVAGTTYYVVVASGAANPTSTQVKAGQDASGNAAIASGSIACANGATEYSAAAGGALANSTTYDVYFVAQDGAGNNLQASPVLVSVTTSGSALAPDISNPTVSAITNNSATLGGNITSNGGSPLTERGTVWSTTTGVTIANNLLAEGSTATGVFTHSRTSLPAKSQIFFKAYAINAIGTTLSTESSFYTLADEPLNQVTGLVATATSNSSVDLTWNSVAGADGFIIFRRQSSSAPTGIPTDANVYSLGTAVGNGIVSANVTSGAATSQTISGLSSATTYTFVVMAYNSDGINSQTFNYLTTGTTSATTATLTPPATTYTWNQTGTASWAPASNWTPTRTAPEISDILKFDGGGSIIVTDVPTQTIAQLLISNNTSVELQSTAIITLNLRGEADVDFTVPTGSSLSINQASGITIALLAGATGTVGGTISYSAGTHKLTATDASAITFQSGASFTSGIGFSGNAFGTVGNSSVVFASGSVYNFISGSNPFGATAPGSAVVFQPGSNYVHKATGTPSFGNRVYANFELNEAGASITATATNPLIIENLTLTSGSISFGVTNTFSIKGNISVASGATLNLNPSSTGTLAFIKVGNQTISGTGTLTVNNLTAANVALTSTLEIDRNLTLLGTLAIDGKVIVNPSKNLTVSGILTNNATEGIVIKSDATGTGSFINNGIAGTGTAKVERFLADARPYYITSPITNASLNTATFTAIAGATSTVCAHFYSFNSAAGSWGSNLSLTNTALSNLKAYAIGFNSTNTTISHTGTLFAEANSTVNCELETAKTFGWNLVGNPYTSAIDWTLIGSVANNHLFNVDPTIWCPTTTDGVRKFATYNGQGGASANGGTQYIPAGQGFWVKATGSGAYFSIPVAAKTHNSQAFFKGTQANELHINLLRDGISDEMVVYFNENAKNSEDIYDSEKKMISDNLLYSQVYSLAPENGKNALIINGLSTFDANSTVVTVPLVLQIGTAGSHTFDAFNISAFDPTIPVFLEDKLTNRYQDLRSTSTYNFNTEKGVITDRFVLYFGNKSTTGIKNIVDNEVSIYEYQQNLYVRFAQPISAKVEIIDLLGKVVRSESINNAENIFSVSNLKGIFMVRVKSANTVYCEKILLK